MELLSKGGYSLPPTGRYKATQKDYAHNRIHHLYRTGLIPRARELECFDCGKQAAEYDHYAGYDGENAEKVQPVCQSCHKKREIERGIRQRVFYRPQKSTPGKKRKDANIRMRRYRANKR